MLIETEERDKVVIIRVRTNHISLKNADQFRSMVVEEISGRSALILEMSEVETLDSSGISAVLGVWKANRGERGKIFFVNAKKRVREIFRGTNLDSLFKWCDSIEQAVLEANA